MNNNSEQIYIAMPRTASRWSRSVAMCNSICANNAGVKMLFVTRKEIEWYAAYFKNKSGVASVVESENKVVAAYDNGSILTVSNSLNGKEIAEILPYERSLEYYEEVTKFSMEDYQYLLKRMKERGKQ